MPTISGVTWAHGSCHQDRSSPMRAHHVIAVVAVILVGFGVKLIFFTPQTAEADSRSIKSMAVDVSQLHQNVRNLPVQKFHDMSVVFPDGD
jgi:hypothetical protein